MKDLNCAFYSGLHDLKHEVKQRARKVIRVYGVIKVLRTSFMIATNNWDGVRVRDL